MAERNLGHPHSIQGDKPVKIYSRGDRHLAIFPEIPQWLIVSSEGRLILEAAVAGVPVEHVMNALPESNPGEIAKTYREFLDLAHTSPASVSSEPVSKSLTARTSVAMIGVTRDCNLACDHCYVDASGSRGQELTLAEHEALARDLIACFAVDPRVTYKVNLTGGEPFMNPDILGIISAYASAGFDINMSTNGLMLDERDIKHLHDLNVTPSVSLDGATALTHERIRGRDTFQPVLDQIKRMVDAGIRVGINSLIHSGNFHELEDIIALVNRLGCSGFNPINLVQLGRACDSALQRVSEVEIFKRISRYLATHPECQHLFAASSLFTSLGAALLAGILCESCGVGNRPCVYIDECGNVYPCANTQRVEFLLGNIRQTPLAECVRIDHPILERLRALSVDSLNPKCTACDVRYFCGGDCRGETFNVTGNLCAPYVACRDRHDSIVELMWIVAENPELFEVRASEYTDRAV